MCGGGPFEKISFKVFTVQLVVFPLITPSHPRVYKVTQGKSVCVRAQELCESRGGRPGLPVSNKPYGPCGRKVMLNRAVCRLVFTENRPNLTDRT